MRSSQLTAGLVLLLGSVGAQAQAADPAGSEAQTAQTVDSTGAEIQLAQVDSSATAEPAAEAPDASKDEAANDDNKWKFYTIGYVWLAHAKGATDVIGPVAPVDLDLGLKDIIKGFKFIFMGAAEAQKGRFVIIGDLSFVHLGVDEGIGIRDPDFLEAELDSRTAEITLIGGYRITKKESPVTVDLLAGGRMNWFKTTLQLDGPNRSIEGSVKQSWLDPLIGARAKIPISEDGKWGVALYGDLGGIVFGSDITWQGVATVDYQINRKMTVGVGWRHWKVHYDDGDFLYNIYQTGPIISLRSRL